MKLKKCIGKHSCGLEKPISEFRKERRSNDGLKNNCKECIKIQAKEYANKPEYKEKAKEYYLLKKDKIKDQSNKRYEENKEEINKKSREDYKLNKEEILKKNKDYYINNKEKIAITNKGYRDKPENKQKAKEYSVVYRDENKERLLKQKKKYYDDNREELLEYQKEYRDKPENKEKIAKQKKEYWEKEENKIIRNQKLNKKYANDINFKIKVNLRNRIWDALKYNRKTGRTLDLLGCTIEELKVHLQSQFTKGMSWDNHGLWHIDHIKPCSLFDLCKKSEQLTCFNFKNLQPLWQVDNLKKGNKY